MHIVFALDFSRIWRIKVTAIGFKKHLLASGNCFDASFTPKMTVENTEATPLVENEDENSQYEELSHTKSPLYRYSMYALSAIIGIPILYFFLVFLPNEAPDSENIYDLAVASKPKVYLHPVIRPSKVKAESEFASEYREELNGDVEFLKDPDSPLKKIPNIPKWEYLSSQSELFKSHLEQLTEKEFDGSERPVKRLILVGDIHGSFKPLMRLLKRVKYNAKYDEVLMLGDFLAKGKHSTEVLDWAVKNQIGCVLGNHEIEILKRYAQFHGLPKLTFVGRHGREMNETMKSEIDIKETYDLDDLMRIAKHLTPKQIEYLRECPLIRELGPVPHLTNRKQTHYFDYPAEGFAVHAGLMWNVKNAHEQNPVYVTTMRNLLPPNWTEATENKHDQVDGVKSEPWTKHWNLFQDLQVRKQLENKTESTFMLGKKVYYGHDAGRGLRFKPYSTGLDSGCVYGVALSSEILWAEVEQSAKSEDSKVVYKHQFVQVSC